MSDTEAKSHQASVRKLRKQREQGSVPTGTEIAGYVSVAAGIAMAGALLSGVPDRVSRLLESALNLADAPPDGPVLSQARDALLPELGLLLAPVVGVVLAASVVTMLIWNKGVVFALKPVTPQLSRISPKSGLTRIYGRRGWVETAVGVLRVTVWGLAALLIAWTTLPALFRNPGCGLTCQWRALDALPITLAAAAIIVLLLAAGIEMLIQRNLFLHEQRMTESEVKRERKDQYGHQQIREERQRLRQEGLAGAAAVGLKQANMCFFHGARAVALRFDRNDTPIPCLSAKATGDAESAALREQVIESGFKARENAEIVAACHSLGVGAPVPRSIYAILGAEMRRMF
ncbi:MAG: EscU/YscU/HrcU family type III secretion system export apparatus switch protein [Pseudomonadota bacterium]